MATMIAVVTTDADVDIEAPDGSMNSIALESSAGWLRTEVKTDQDGLYRAHVKVSAQSHAHEIRDLDLGTFSMLGVYRAPPIAESEETEAARDDPAEAVTPSDDIDWKIVGVVIVGINLFLLLLLIVGWLFLKRGKDGPEMILEEE